MQWVNPSSPPSKPAKTGERVKRESKPRPRVARGHQPDQSPPRSHQSVTRLSTETPNISLTCTAWPAVHESIHFLVLFPSGRIPHYRFEHHQSVSRHSASAPSPIPSP
ncbi:unnamed protein product [Periconia digitata]|uniref:Uncharacterized protein n=1 Tax=Periconia digitata TaxID=1303443 RepID=A0A9W4UC02_9PLEO|nr:unnamed protein product [Periconia digitata]